MEVEAVEVQDGIQLQFGQLEHPIGLHKHLHDQHQLGLHQLGQLHQNGTLPNGVSDPNNN